MTDEQDKQTLENNRRGEPQFSRRSFIEKSAIGLGALALAASGDDVFGQTKAPIEPKPNRANPNGKFANKIVLITGATSGIGEGTAYAFAKEGAKVFFCGRRENLGRQVEAKIKSFGGEAAYLKADVRIEQDVKNFVEACVRKYGRVDIAFNNAGIESSPGAIAEKSWDEWSNVMATNAGGVFLSMKYELPVMLKQAGGGAIINNASVSGHVGFATISPYSASKHAILSLTKVAALEYADKNIRVNSISPGAVETPMLRRALAAWKTSFETVAKDYPLRRIVQPEEIARAVMFLASDEATCILGTDVDATGGYLTK